MHDEQLKDIKDIQDNLEKLSDQEILDETKKRVTGIDAGKFKPITGKEPLSADFKEVPRTIAQPLTDEALQGTEQFVASTQCYYTKSQEKETEQFVAVTRSVIQEAQKRGTISPEMAEELISRTESPDFVINQEAFKTASDTNEIKTIYSTKTSDNQTFSIDYIPNFLVPTGLNSTQLVNEPQLPGTTPRESTQPQSKTAPAIAATLSKNNKDGCLLGVAYNEGDKTTLVSYSNPQEAFTQYSSYKNVVAPRTPKENSFRTDFNMRCGENSVIGVDLTNQEGYWESKDITGSNRVFLQLDTMNQGIGAGYRKKLNTTHTHQSIEARLDYSKATGIGGGVGYNMEF